MPNSDAREILGLPDYSGFSGYSGQNSLSGYSGISGANPGQSGYSGISGESGASGYSGVSGIGISGYSGLAGTAASTGDSGYSGKSGSSLTSYIKTFNATSDWATVGGYYYIDINHVLNSLNLMIQVWNTSVTPNIDPIPASPYYETQTVPKPYLIERTDVNNMRLKTNKVPDDRFAGTLIIVKVP